MRAHIFILMLALVVSCGAPTEALDEDVLPVSGTPIPALAAFDEAMREYMTARGKNGATLAVMKDGIVVLERGYGWKDQAQQILMPPDALMRLASVTKPVTAAAVRQLIRAGTVNAADRVFCLPGGGPCWFDLAPLGPPDARLQTPSASRIAM